MKFQVGKSVAFGLDVRQSVTFGFDLGGSAPAPSQQSTIYGNVSCIENVTGSFANGALYGNTGYRMVEYLKSTGTQYIVTDIVPTYSTRTELDCKFDVTNYDNVNVVFFGIQAGGDGKWYLTSLEKGSGSSRRNCSFYIGFQWYSGISSVTITDVSYSSRNIVVCHYPRSAYGSNTITITEQITQQQPDVGVTFFGVTNTNGISGRAFNVGDMYLYGAKMYDNGNLSHNLIPVERTQDNELGLLDVMTGVFYTNTGTGTFAKGGYV
jgi:hypothetical protein